jgi:5-methyltetrahydropteroyltriglutamate--homocysteine methyltransferase
VRPPVFLGDAARYVDIGQLCLPPQCGFPTKDGNDLTADQLLAKLRRVVETAQEVWGA